VALLVFLVTAMTGCRASQDRVSADQGAVKQGLSRFPRRCGTGRAAALRHLAFRSPILPIEDGPQLGPLLPAQHNVNFRQSRLFGRLWARTEAVGSNSLDDGVWRIYDTTGRLRMEGDYRGGKRNGPWRCYAADGRQMIERRFRDDTPLSMRSRTFYLNLACPVPDQTPKLARECATFEGAAQQTD